MRKNVQGWEKVRASSGRRNNPRYRTEAAGKMLRQAPGEVFSISRRVSPFPAARQATHLCFTREVDISCFVLTLLQTQLSPLEQVTDVLQQEPPINCR